MAKTQSEKKKNREQMMASEKCPNLHVVVENIGCEQVKAEVDIFGLPERIKDSNSSMNE